MAEDGRRERATPAQGSTRPVRFPYTRAAMAAAGIVLAVWLWVGESWRFDVTPEELLRGSPGWGWKGGWVGRLVRLRAEYGNPQSNPLHSSVDLDVIGTKSSVCIRLPADLSPIRSGAMTGRIVQPEDAGPLVVDVRRGRWTAKSVIAILILLWGGGIIVSSVWVWQKRRKLTTEITENTGDD